MKSLKTVAITLVGIVAGIYAWSFAKSAAYGDMDVAEDEVDWAGAEDYDDEPYDGYVDEHSEYCEDCLKALGEPGVLTSGKLRAIAGWLEYSDGLLSELLHGLEDLPPSMDQEQLQYLQFTLGNHSMSDDLETWADMFDHNLDPTDPTQVP